MNFYLLLCKPGIYHEHNSVYCERRLRNVCRHDTLSADSSVRSTRWSGFKNPLQKEFPFYHLKILQPMVDEMKILLHLGLFFM